MENSGGPADRDDEVVSIEALALPSSLEDIVVAVVINEDDDRSAFECGGGEYALFEEKRVEFVRRDKREPALRFLQELQEIDGHEPTPSSKESSISRPSGVRLCPSSASLTIRRKSL